MQQVGFGVFFYYPLFVSSCPINLVKSMIFSFLGTGQTLLQKATGQTHFYIALKHGADTFCGVSTMGRILFSTTLKPMRRYLQKQNAVAAIFFTEIADSD